MVAPFEDSSQSEFDPLAARTRGQPAGPSTKQFENVDIRPSKKRSLQKLGLVVLLLAAAAAFMMYRSQTPTAAVRAPLATANQLDADLPPTAAGDSAQPSAPPASAPALPPVTLRTLFDEITTMATGLRQSLTEQARVNERIDQLSQDVALIAAAIKEDRDAQAKRNASAAQARAPSAARQASAKAARVAAAAAASAPQVQTKLLAVDIWDGVPSAAIGNTGDKRVRFLNPSDSVAGVSMVAANPAAQTATVQVGERTITLQRDQ